ncbi:MAG: DUF5011 domain-containing protein, partial [Sulfuricaulis sp.]|nr:DUF5011 domain-containing protein [Sulfuricaulis sp.]
GNVGIGNTTGLGGRFGVTWASGSQQGLIIQTSDASFVGSPVIFYNSSSVVSGFIGQSTSAVTYNTSSDRRIKENIDYTKLGLDTLMQLPVREFSFISDSTHATTTGFIAQELYEVFPFAVSTNGDNGIDALTGSSTPWSVDYGRITPLLTKAIQDIASIGDTFKANLIAWLADAGNGIGDFLANRVIGNQLCAKKGDGTLVCVSGDQLAGVLSGTPSVQISDPTPPTTGDTTTAPSINIAGNNPATIYVGDTYNDLGAIATDNEGHELSYRTFINGVLSGDILIDTSHEATDTIDYVATDTWGNTATSTRTVIVDAVAATVVATDANTSTSTSSATSSPSGQ